MPLLGAHIRLACIVLIMAAASAMTIPKKGVCSSNIADVGGLAMIQLVGDEECSTNRALGYAIGRQFKDNIAARIKALGPQLEKAIVRTSCYHPLL